MVHVDPNTTKNPSWSASHAFISREERRSSSIFAAKAHTVVTVAQGKLERRGGAWLPIIIDRASSTILTGGLDYPDLLRLIDVQHHWRSVLRDRREERAKLRRMASIRIQASLRGRLARKLTTCLICMEEVPYSAKVSTVPEAKCHRVCFTCARQYVDSAIADGRLFIRCPGEACTHLMDSSAFCSPAALTTYRANLKYSHERRLDGETDAAFVAFCREHARACPACGVLRASAKRATASQDGPRTLLRLYALPPPKATEVFKFEARRHRRIDRRAATHFHLLRESAGAAISFGAFAAHSHILPVAARRRRRAA